MVKIIIVIIVVILATLGFRARRRHVVQKSLANSPRVEKLSDLKTDFDLVGPTPYLSKWSSKYFIRGDREQFDAIKAGDEAAVTALLAELFPRLNSNYRYWQYRTTGFDRFDKKWQKYLSRHESNLKKSYERKAELQVLKKDFESIGHPDLEVTVLVEYKSKRGGGHKKYELKLKNEEIRQYLTDVPPLPELPIDARMRKRRHAAEHAEEIAKTTTVLEARAKREAELLEAERFKSKKMTRGEMDTKPLETYVMVPNSKRYNAVQQQVAKELLLELLKQFDNPMFVGEFEGATVSK